MPFEIIFHLVVTLWGDVESMEIEGNLTFLSVWVLGFCCCLVSFLFVLFCFVLLCLAFISGHRKAPMPTAGIPNHQEVALSFVGPLSQSDVFPFAFGWVKPLGSESAEIGAAQ